MAGSPEEFPRVCLVTMARDSLILECHIGIVASLHEGLIALHLVVPAGPYLDAGRNKAIGNALQYRDTYPWDWFVFVDSDIEFLPDTLRTLLTPTLHPDYDPTRYPVIGGVYVNPFPDNGVPGEEDDDPRNGHFGPVCYEYVEVDDLPGREGVPTMNLRRLSRARLASRPPVNEDWNPGGAPSSDPDGPPYAPSPICAVDAIGTGFLAIHISLIDAMQLHYGAPLPWFDEPVRDGVHFGEDMGFALRCMDLGYPVLAHRGCTPIHHKTTKLV